MANELQPIKTSDGAIITLCDSHSPKPYLWLRLEMNANGIIHPQGFATGILDEAQVRALIGRLEAWLAAIAPAAVMPNFSMQPIKWSEIGHTLLRELAHEGILQEIAQEWYEVRVEGEMLYLVWIPTSKRAGFAWPDPGPAPVWTNAESPEDAVRKFVRGEVQP